MDPDQLVFDNLGYHSARNPEGLLGNIDQKLEVMAGMLGFSPYLLLLLGALVAGVVLHRLEGRVPLSVLLEARSRPAASRPHQRTTSTSHGGSVPGGCFHRARGGNSRSVRAENRRRVAPRCLVCRRPHAGDLHGVGRIQSRVARRKRRPDVCARSIRLNVLPRSSTSGRDPANRCSLRGPAISSERTRVRSLGRRTTSLRMRHSSFPPTKWTTTGWPPESS